MAPPGLGTMAQVCTLGYCHRANAGGATSRAAPSEHGSPEPAVGPAHRLARGKVRPLAEEGSLRRAGGRGLHAGQPGRSPVPPAFPLLLSPFLCHLLLSPGPVAGGLYTNSHFSTTTQNAKDSSLKSPPRLEAPAGKGRARASPRSDGPTPSCWPIGSCCPHKATAHSGLAPCYLLLWPKGPCRQNEGFDGDGPAMRFGKA